MSNRGNGNEELVRGVRRGKACDITVIERLRSDHGPDWTRKRWMACGC